MMGSLCDSRLTTHHTPTCNAITTLTMKCKVWKKSVKKQDISIQVGHIYFYCHGTPLCLSLDEVLYTISA